MSVSFVPVYMKKLFIILLAWCYLLLSSGFTRYTHMCKGTDVKLYNLVNTGHQDSDSPCPVCLQKQKDLKKKKKDCCQHEAKVIKVDTGVKKQAQSDASVKFLGNTIPDRTLGAVFEFLLLADIAGKNTPYLSPPILTQDNLLYILYCVYRI